MAADTLPIPSAPASSPVASVQITPQPASGLKGPAGMGPRTNYSNVQTGTPPAPDFSSTQKTLEPPKLGAMPISTPAISDLVKAASAGAHARIKQAEAHKDDCKCEECCKKKDCGKTASALPTEYVSKLAALGADVAHELRKTASENPGGIPESTAKKFPPLPDHFGQAKTPIPVRTPIEGTSVATSTAAKHASEGAGAIPESDARKADGDPVGGKPQGPTHLIASNAAAIDATQADTVGNRRADMGKWVKEPMFSRAHDSTLQAAFTHTEGSKMASVGEWVKGKAKAVRDAASNAGKKYVAAVKGEGVVTSEGIKGGREAAAEIRKNVKSDGETPALLKKIEESVSSGEKANRNRQLKAIGGTAAAAGVAAGGAALAYKHHSEKNASDDLSIETASATALLERLEEEARRARGE